MESGRKWRRKEKGMEKRGEDQGGETYGENGVTKEQRYTAGGEQAEKEGVLRENEGRAEEKGYGESKEMVE